MAKTTATVTVGADTSPFERKMRTLGKGISGGVTTGVSRVGGMAMSGLGAGLGVGAAFLGLQGIGSIFDKLLAVSPELNAAMTRLKVAIGDALVPVAFKLAQFLNQSMPTIEAGLKMFGNALTDAIQFWTEDAFNPEVWKDIGMAIGESVIDAINFLKGGASGAVEGMNPAARTAAMEAGMVDPALAQGVAAFQTGSTVEGVWRIVQAVMGPGQTEGANSL